MKFFMIRLRQFRWKIELPVTKLCNFQSWNLQLRSLLQTNVARPIFWSICLPPPPSLHPAPRVKTHQTADSATFRILHITHRSAVIFHTFHSAFFLLHAANLHFTNSPVEASSIYNAVETSKNPISAINPFMKQSHLPNTIICSKCR